jgi:internalin A
LIHLKSVVELKSLNLNGTKVTDAGMRHLAAITKLWSLSVSRTKVTTAGLKQLQACSQLRLLDADDTSLTPADVHELRKLMPAVQVTIRYPQPPNQNVSQEAPSP